MGFFMFWMVYKHLILEGWRIEWSVLCFVPLATILIEHVFGAREWMDYCLKSLRMCSTPALYP